MATKKAASVAKKSAAKQTTTKVTTVKAVESRPAMQAPASSKRAVRFSLARTPLVAALIAEFIGTFIFAATIIAGQGQPILVFFALVGVVLAVGTISGAYVNPALVLNAYVNAAPAASPDAYNTATQLFKAAVLPEGKEWFVFFAEFVGALIFGFAVAGATREKKERTAAAFTVGLGVFLGLMIAGSAAAFVGANSILNPAVAISLQAINFNSVWPVAVYVVGSSLGAIVGFVLYDMLRSNDQDQTV